MLIVKAIPFKVILASEPLLRLHEGEPALMTAARTGKPGPVKALLKHGAKLNAAGADFVIDTVTDLPALMEKLDAE